MNALGKKLTAEALGTFWLVFIGCGSVVMWQVLANGIMGRELRGMPVSRSSSHRRRGWRTLR